MVPFEYPRRRRTQSLHLNRLSMKRNLKNFCFPVLLLAAMLLLQISANAQQPYLLALSKTDHTLAIVNPLNLSVIAKIPVGPDPHEVIASSDGKFAYVSNTGGGQSTEIDVIDLVARKALPAIDTRPLFGPHGLDYAAGKLWFSAEGSKSVGRYDPASGKIDWCMGTGQERTHMVYVSPDARKIYTSNVNASTVSILQDSLLPATAFPPVQTGNSQPPRRHDWVQTVVPVAKGSEGFDVSPDGKELWTAGAADGMISIIDPGSSTSAVRLDAGVQGANRLKFTPDGKRVLVTSLRTGVLTVVDASTRKTIKRIPVGRGSAGILVDPNGTHAFLGCTPDNYVAIIDLLTLEMTGKIDVGGGPDGLAWAIVH